MEAGGRDATDVKGTLCVLTSLGISVDVERSVYFVCILDGTSPLINSVIGCKYSQMALWSQQDFYVGFNKDSMALCISLLGEMYS